MEFYSLEMLEQWLLPSLYILTLCLASAHVLITREQVSDAAAWLGMIWLVPGLGLALYFLFGFNRIKRRAVKTRLRRGMPIDPEGQFDLSLIPGELASAGPQWVAHGQLGNQVTGQDLSAGNAVTMYSSGGEAYRAMLAAIRRAGSTVLLSTYIFESDRIGRKFIAALRAAQRRGVEIRVLYDAVGNLYGLHPASRKLRREGIPAAPFNPLRIGWKMAFFNLRTHRKLLIVDAEKAFTGGMNIRRHHLPLADGSQNYVMDRHFLLEGPVVADMVAAFASDWLYATGKELTSEFWPATSRLAGRVVCRAVADGPDRSRPLTRTLIMSALSSARRDVLVRTPYFLPDAELRAALERAALRGVRVMVLLPERSNLPLFDMVMDAQMKSLLGAGVEIYRTPGPFDHSKAMVVDSCWCLFGSTNWDARSLRLNFEFNMEAFDETFGALLHCDITARAAGARRIHEETLASRPLWRRSLGRVLWLLTPYL